MVDQTPRYRPYDPDVDIHDKTLTDRRVAPYKFEQSVRTEDPVPVFLSDYDGEPDPSEYVTPLRKYGRRSVSAGILAGVLATAAAAILFALFSSDATRDIIVNAKASIAASLPAPYAARSSRHNGRGGADARGNHDGLPECDAGRPRSRRHTAGRNTAGRSSAGCRSAAGRGTSCRSAAGTCPRAHDPGRCDPPPRS